MARLGRGRRIKATILRGRSITTATPLVRKRVVVELDRKPWLLGLGRQRRIKAKILRAPRNAPTATPLIRKRLVQTPVANDRAMTIGRVWRRKRARITLKAPLGLLKSRQPIQVIIGRAAARAAVHVRGFQPRGARISRGVSTSTPTPLVRRRVVLSPNANERARFRASWLKPRPRRIIRPPAPIAATPSQPRKPVIVTSRRAALKARLSHSRPRLVRAPAWPQRPRPVVAKTSRRLRTRRPRPQILRPPAPVAATPSSPRRKPLIVLSRRAALKARMLRHKPRILRAPLQPVRPRGPIVSGSQDRPSRLKTRRARAKIVASHVPPPTVVVRHAPIVSRQRRDRVVRAYYVRRRTHLETSTLGAAAGFVIGPPITTVTRATGAAGLTHVSTTTGITGAAGASGLTEVDTVPGETLADGGSGVTQSSLGGS